MTEKLYLVGRAQAMFGDMLRVGDPLPHTPRRRRRGQFDCPDRVDRWRKPFRGPYRNDWLVGCPACQTLQWRFCRWQGKWTLRSENISTHGEPLCPLDVREDLVLFTDGKYPEEICPWTIAEESWITLKRCGRAVLGLSCDFYDASQGYRIILRSRGQFWMSSGLQERQDMREVASLCPPGARALVGGLGLGLVVMELCRRGAQEVVVYEIDPDIARLVWPYLLRWHRSHGHETALRLVVDDVRNATGEFDFVFMDTWPKASPRYRDQVLEMRAKGRELVRPGGQLVCWQEERILRVH